jgi:hypothetical protein
MSNRNVDRDEDFNTRYASYRGWQMAIERVKPIPRTRAARHHAHGARRRLQDRGSTRCDYFEGRFLSLPLDGNARRARRIPRPGTRHQRPACRRATYAEDALRLLLHLMHEPPGIPARLRTA